jgi:phosphate transport system protein
MVHDALAAFEHEDVAIAHAVVRWDDEVDALDAAVFRTLLDHLSTHAGAATPALSLLLLARSLERVADHATNIGEEVHYLVEGHDIRHQE